jgi:hypothetical protein
MMGGKLKGRENENRRKLATREYLSRGCHGLDPLLTMWPCHIAFPACFVLPPLMPASSIAVPLVPFLLFSKLFINSTLA